MTNLDGSLLWSVKESLLDYLQAIPDAQVSGTRAFEAPHAPFAFSESAESSPSSPRYAGSLRIVAHGGLMDIDLKDPVATRRGDHWVVAFREADGALLEFVRLSGVAERQIGELVVRRSIDVSLLMHAARLFGGSYAPYTRMAPLEFSCRVTQ